MRTVGMFEAKAKLSELCDEVARSGKGIVVTRRGIPLVRIDPVVTERFSVWEQRAKYVARKGKLKDEFDLPPRSGELPDSPIEE